jgi:O-6-methylguanine DNA methyltransferase
MIRHGVYPCPLGTLVIGYTECKIVSVKLVSETNLPHRPSPLSDFAAGQIMEYFLGDRKDFDLPIGATGTPFQTAVWRQIRNIPYGQTHTYGQTAAAIGSPKAARAVGSACNRNSLWILIPCHRVVGKNGNLTGYAGGLTMKQALLELEQSYKNTPEA